MTHIKERKKRLSLSINESLDNRVEQFSASRMESKNTWILEAIRMRLEQEELKEQSA